MMEVHGARKIFLLDDDGMSQTPGGIAQLHHAETSVAIVHPKDANPFQPHLGVDAPCECETLDAIVLNRREVPRDKRLGNGEVRRGAVDNWNLRPECSA